MTEGNVRWGVFWAIAGACFVFTAGCYAFSYYGQQNSMAVIIRVSEKLTDAIVANDRTRQSDKSELQCRVDATNVNVNNKLDNMAKDLNEVKVSIARIVK